MMSRFQRKKREGSVKKSLRNDPNRAAEQKKYESPVASRDYILSYLKECGKPVSQRELVAVFGFQDDEARMEGLRRRLIAMVRDGQLLKNRRHQFVVVSADIHLIIGYVMGHRDGFGFVIPEDKTKRDLFISPKQMQKILPGDRVLTRIMPAQGHDKDEGIIVEVLTPVKELVGQFFKEDNVAFITPYDPNIIHDIIIPEERTKGASVGQYVVVRLLNRPSRHRQATAEVIQILGDDTNQYIEQQVIIQAHRLPHIWSNAVLRAVDAFSEKSIEEALSDPLRRDMRDVPFVTIDGEDAKDFDDAVYAEPLSPNKGWRLFVAVADVSHYVQKGSALDLAAYARGTSIYFPGSVLPMLPERLSNQLCSLQPDVDRLAMVCEMRIDRLGRLAHAHFHQAVIRSKARLTYDQVRAALKGDQHRLQSDLRSHLEALHALYCVAKLRRERAGALQFSVAETKVVLDEASGQIKHIVPLVRHEAHEMIEVCMLFANVSAARCLLKNNMVALFRMHAGPDSMKLEKLREFLSAMGVRLKGGMKPSSKDYATLLQKIQGRSDQNCIELMVLRSLSQAIYTPHCPEHFGLAFREYCQFTSPIRRYPDLIVHRALKHIVLKKGGMKTFAYSLAQLEAEGKHCSMTERRGDQAQQELVSWLKCRYMNDKLGQSLKGVVVNVTPFGLFVQLETIHVEGLLHVSHLAGDYYQFDAASRRLTGQNSGRVYAMGDVLDVVVSEVDLSRRCIDFQLSRTSAVSD